MLTIHSLIQRVYGFVKYISKKSYRDCAIVTAGTVVVALITLNSSNFNGSGKNKVVVLDNSVKVQKIKEDEKSIFETIAISEMVAALDTVSQPKLVAVREPIKRLETAQMIASGVTQVPEVAMPEVAMLEEAQVATQEVPVPTPEEATVSAPATASEVNPVPTTEVATAPAPAPTPEAAPAPAPAPEAAPVVEVVTPRIELSAEDYEALTRIVEAEAGGEDEKGKILVANVIFNRVNHGEFPDTVKEVVFQKSGGSAQFSPTVDGRYYSIEVSENTKAAVEKVLSGTDESQGALFFSARSKANPNDMSWFDRNLNWLYKYGGHEFYTLK